MEMNAKNAAECRRDTGLYGNYIKVKVENIPLAKDLMLDNLVATIRELAKREDFFIIKKHEDVPDDPLLQLIKFKSGIAEDEATVGWKIQLPQMKE